MLLQQTGGNLKLINAEPRHMEETINKLKECGCNIKIEKDQIYLKAPEKLCHVDIETEPYPVSVSYKNLKLQTNREY